MTQLPTPPCEHCTGLCCKSRRKLSVELQPHEAALYPEAVTDHADPRYPVRGIPTKDGKCIHLGDDDRCRIYDRRPELCRSFNCLHGYFCSASPHSFLLGDHPELVELIEIQQPEFCAERKKQHGLVHGSGASLGKSG